VVWDADHEREIVLLTNLLDFGATTIAAIYKERWQIELFFEGSTWCTPSDAMEFQEPIGLNCP
jgi:IS4 transposase